MLYNNEEIKFDVTTGGNKFVCRNNKDHTVSNVSEFTRTAKFIRIMKINFTFIDIYCINHE